MRLKRITIFMKRGGENMINNLVRFYCNKTGSVLIENKAIMILTIVTVFGVSGLLFDFLQDYFNDFTNGVTNAGQNTSFRSVTWQ